jgi:hypothetical protein
LTELGEQDGLSDDTGVGEEDIQTTVLSEGFVDNLLDARVIGGIEATGMNFDLRKGGS